MQRSEWFEIQENVLDLTIRKSEGSILNNRVISPMRKLRLLLQFNYGN